MINLMRKLGKQERSLTDAFPVIAIENDKVVFRDGRISIGFEIHGAEMETWSPADYASFNNQLVQQLGNFPDETTIQKTDIFYHQDFVGDTDSREFFEMKLNKHFSDHIVLHHRSYLFLTFPTDGSQWRSSVHPLNTLMVATKSMMGTNIFRNIERSLGSTEGLGTEFMRGMDGKGGITLRRLLGHDLLKLYNDYFTLDFNDDPEGYSCAITANRDGVQVGEKRLNIVTMQNRGAFIDDAVVNGHGVTSAYTYMLGNYLQIPHITTTTLRLDNTEKGLKKLDNNNFFNKTVGRLKTQDNDISGETIEAFTAMVRRENQRLASVSVNVMIYDADPHIRQKYVEDAKREIRGIAGSQCIVEASDTLALYFANAPGNAFNNYRWMLMSDMMGSKYFNFTTNTRSAQKGDLICDRFGNPIRVNFFNTKLSNQNAIIVGETGGGKSYTNGFFMIQRKERKARQVIIDKGGTYRNMMQMLNGDTFEQTYFEYDPAKPMSFAPFRANKTTEGIYEVDHYKMKMLMGLLVTIWKGAKNIEGMEEVEKSILLDIIERYYQHAGEHDITTSFSTFYEYCQSLLKAEKNTTDVANWFTYFDMQAFLLVTRKYYDGNLKDLLNAAVHQDLSSHDLICFDLAHVQDDEMIYPVVTQLIIQLVLDQLKDFPNDEKFIYIDEAWSMLEGTLGDFMQGMYRTIRKLNGSIWIITQNIDDIIKSRHARAILANAATKVVLRHTDNSLAHDVADALGFTDHGRDLLFSLRDGGYFRDICIKMGEQTRVYALESPPHQDAVLSSKPEERNEFVRILKKYGSQALALEEFVEKKLSS
ncbi:MAG: TraM recognition domain-containing protein [Cyclobacteriaceae bacterium]